MDERLDSCSAQFPVSADDTCLLSPYYLPSCGLVPVCGNAPVFGYHSPTHSPPLPPPTEVAKPSDLPGPQTPSRRLGRNAMLSRQSSFDYGIEGKLSSSQVKQRLKTHLLNRRRRSIVSDRHPRLGEFRLGRSLDTHHCDYHSKGNHSPGRFAGPWHSADCARTFRWETVGRQTPHRSSARLWSLNSLSNELPSESKVGLRRSSVTTCPTYQQGNDLLASSTIDQSLLDAIEQLTGHVVLKDAGQPTNSLSNLATLGGDIRKTLSAPDLVENPWPLRIVTQLLLHHSSATSGQPSTTTTVTTNNTATTTATPPTAITAFSNLTSLLRQRLSSTQSDLHSKTANLGASNSTGSEMLENRSIQPLLLLAPSVSPADRPVNTKGPITDSGVESPSLRLSCRPPLESSASEDSALQRATCEFKLRAYVTDLMLALRDKSQPDANALASQWARELQALTLPAPLLASDWTALSCETVMDWETDVHSRHSPNIRAKALTPTNIPQIASEPSPDNQSCSGISTESHVLHSNRPHCSLSPWSDLPVEDWSGNAPSEGVVPATECTYLPTGLAFDPDMLEHACLCTTNSDPHVHPECPNRIHGILERLSNAFFQFPPSLVLDARDLLGVLQAAVSIENPALQKDLAKVTDLNVDYIRSLITQIPLVGFCRLLRARMATEKELCLFHSDAYVHSFRGVADSPSSVSSSSHSNTNSSHLLPSRLCKLGCGGLGVDSDTVWNPTTTARAARLAVGQVVCLAHMVATRQLCNGFALIRPPGHHAEPDQAMGFCYFNSVAVAALHLLRNCSLSRVLILDWDIHHGNGTKLATTRHPGLVYVSLHRYDSGTFFPGTGPTEDQSSCTSMYSTTGIGRHDSTGKCDLAGHSQLINIAWETPQIKTDAQSRCAVDAEARWEIWRQYYARRKCGRYDPKISKHMPQSGEGASSISTHSTTSTRDNDGLTCCCCCSNPAGNGATMDSSGSSQFCSFCLTCSMRSSPTSSVHSGSPFCDSPADHNPTVPQQLSHADKATASTRQSLLGFGDAEYLAAMRCVVLPVALEFQPEVILISAGFDAAPGHGEALGGYSVSPGTFAWITRQCSSVANGRVVLALEGGYNTAVVGDCVMACLNSLLLPTPHKQWHPHASHPDPEAHLDAYRTACDWISSSELNRPPCSEAVLTLMNTIRYQSNCGWRCMQHMLEENVAMSFSEAMNRERLHAFHPANSITALERAKEFEMHTCNSPLTARIAQLHMDHS